ncbi:uncharacterized protein EI97DRAFT_18183 [Westerdykella ornata]|uniref:Uncharacterized protein n=1 Tax=Westerdykella ornata TaxID=318751 RepID=A0A6A6JY47_WESOR|nr:uncharacterized protein EI97DRAFT_18183 [Westerdykella ornata]KAF2281013.1 hypothetical protein EI97DRAFT_18183 [Westerdykella ornata]
MPHVPYSVGSISVGGYCKVLLCTAIGIDASGTRPLRTGFERRLFGWQMSRWGDGTFATRREICARGGVLLSFSLVVLTDFAFVFLVRLKAFCGATKNWRGE